MQTTRIAFLHLAPILGNVAHNRALVEEAVTKAAQEGAGWIITPELCICGYGFAGDIGTEWVLPQPDPWMQQICCLAARLQVSLFLSHPERDPQSGQLYNTVFVITPDGQIVGKHRKINVIPIAEGWSSPGVCTVPVSIPPAHVGILICADAYSMKHAQNLKRLGAELLVSSASWAPGEYGPNGEWEQCTRATGLPLLVCNRTGVDRTLDFTGAVSAVVQDGQRVLSLQSAISTIFIIDWDWQMHCLSSLNYQRVSL